MEQFYTAKRRFDFLEVQGFPQKDARFSKLKIIPDLLSPEKEGKIMEIIDPSYLSHRASFMGNSVTAFLIF